MKPNGIGSTLVLAFLFSAPTVLAQSQFKFKEVVQAGDAAPVPPQIGSILEFAFSDQGNIALIADGGLILKSGNTVIPIAGPGDPAPGGGVFLSFSGPSIGPQGQVAFTAGSPLPSASPSTAGAYVFFNGAITQLFPNGIQANTGETVFPGTATFIANGNLLITDANSGTLYLLSNDTLTRLVGPGDPAPGGSTFSFLAGVMNSSNQLVFQAFLSDGRNGIFLLSNGTLTKIIASGDIMQDGVPLGFTTNPLINNSGLVVFSAVSNSIADTGIFSYFQGKLSLLVPELAPLPDGSVLFAPFVASLNNAGQMTFFASTTEANNATFLFSNGQISTLVAPGQTAPDGGVFRFFDLSGSIINQSGQVLVVAAEVHEGSTLYLFSNSQLSRVIGTGDTIPRQPTFAFPMASALGAGDTTLIADSTFPGGAGAYTATPSHGTTPGLKALAVHMGEPSPDGVVDFLFGFAMNHSTEVASLIASSDAGGALLLNNGSTPKVVADSSPTSPIDVGGGTPSISINSLGVIAFLGFDPSSATSGIFLNSAGQSQLLLNASTPAPGGGTFNNVSNLALNSLNQVAFEAQPFPGPTGIFGVANGAVTPLATDGAPAPGGGNFQLFFLDSRHAPVIDDRGDVAFASFLTGTSGGFFGSGGVFLYKNGAVSRIVGPNDPSPDGGVFLYADSPSINSSGDVAFFAETSAFNFGAFVYSGGTITQVAVAGDFVNNIGFGFVDLPIINNNRHVAFTATLFNGQNAVFAAVPPYDAASLSSGDWITPTHKTPPPPQHMKQARVNNDLLRSKWGKPHSGANVKVINP